MTKLWFSLRNPARRTKQYRKNKKKIWYSFRFAASDALRDVHISCVEYIQILIMSGVSYRKLQILAFIPVAAPAFNIGWMSKYGLHFFYIQKKIIPHTKKKYIKIIIFTKQITVVLLWMPNEWENFLSSTRVSSTTSLTLHPGTTMDGWNAHEHRLNFSYHDHFLFSLLLFIYSSVLKAAWLRIWDTSAQHSHNIHTHIALL